MTLKTFALVALLATQAPTTSEEAPDTAAEAAGKAYFNSLQASMRNSGSARERALAARMALVQDPKGTGKALRAAAESAPGDGLVQMLWSGMGQPWNGCDTSSPCPEQALAWSRAEPGNGLAWLPAFQATYKSGNEQAIDAAIARIADAEVYDDHVIDAWSAYRTAIAAHPMPMQFVHAWRQQDAERPRDEKAARMEAAGVIAMAHAAAMPLSIQSLTHACDRARHPQLDTARFDHCAAIGRGLVQSNASVISKRIGSALVRMSGLENEADRQAQREHVWAWESASELLDERKHPGVLAGYFDDLASTGSETRAQELLMARHGVALQPPAEWQSRWQDGGR